MSHLLAVCSLLLENGGDEDEAIAALVHDAVEDQGGKVTLNLIDERFGDRVAGIVEGCSGRSERPKPPALERKRAYVARLDTDGTSKCVLLVSEEEPTSSCSSTGCG